MKGDWVSVESLQWLLEDDRETKVVNPNYPGK